MTLVGEEIFQGEIHVSQDYTVAGTVQFGENGDLWGAPELAVITPEDIEADWVLWDEDPFDGIQSEFQNFTFIAKAGENGLSLKLGETEVTTDVVALDGIHQIDIVNVVAPEMAIDWYNANIQLYRDGELIEAFGMSSLGLDETYDFNGLTQQQIVRIVTDTEGIDEVRFTGEFRLRANEGVYPSPTDIFSQIQIYA